jgi:4-amino-4-deoxy-L-arabinose transferase-like glycosyltransferase
VPTAAGLPRRHWLLALLLAAGLTLRVLTQLAYQPALLYIDSTKYLLGAYPGDDPPGYQLLLRPLLALGNLDLVAVLQHLLGLAMAVTLYAVLLRRGVPRWLAALAAAPLLLDAYQLQIEQMIMPDLTFEVLIVAALAALLWEPRPRPWMLITAGLALGASATVAQVGEIFILPALVYLVITVDDWRLRLKQGAVLCLAFALPILFGSYKNYVSIHRFSLAPYAASSIYGRMAQSADCATLQVPASERGLCPTKREKAVLGPDGLDHDKGSPIKTFRNPALVKDFWHRVVIQQPQYVAKSIGKDALKLFALTRDGGEGDAPITRWQFQTYYPLNPPYTALVNGSLVFGTYTPRGVEKTIGTGQRFGAEHPAVNRRLASFLRAYQLDGGYTPGPLYLLTVLAGLAGSLAAFRRRAAQAQQLAARACLLFFAAGAAVMLISDVFEFSWRYQLPALVTLPPACALAITLLLTRRRRSREVPAATAAGTTVPAVTGEAGEVPALEPPEPGAQTWDRAPAS